MLGSHGTIINSVFLYVYDMLIFCQGSKRSANSIKDVFQQYGEYYGLQIKFGKSNL